MWASYFVRRKIHPRRGRLCCVKILPFISGHPYGLVGEINVLTTKEFYGFGMGGFSTRAYFKTHDIAIIGELFQNCKYTLYAFTIPITKN